MPDGKDVSGAKDMLAQLGTGGASKLGGVGKLAGGLGIAFLLQQLLGEGTNAYMLYRQQEIEKQGRRNQSLANAMLINQDANREQAERIEGREAQQRELAMMEKMMGAQDRDSYRQALVAAAGDGRGGMPGMSDARGYAPIADADAMRIMQASQQGGGFFRSLGLM